MHQDKEKASYAIRGTFLLTDAKMRGSAVRGHGHDKLGAGFSGELDMSLQWMHTSRLDPPPSTPKSGALTQLTANGAEDSCKIGNFDGYGVSARRNSAKLDRRRNCGPGRWSQQACPQPIR